MSRPQARRHDGRPRRRRGRRRTRRSRRDEPSVPISRDLDALTHLLAVDLVVNAPINRVVDRDNLLERNRRHEVNYADGPSTTNVEFAEARHDLVVIMGEEIVHPVEHTPQTGSTVHRRFTDVWRPHAPSWQLAIRQATITHIDPV